MPGIRKPKRFLFGFSVMLLLYLWFDTRSCCPADSNPLQTNYAGSFVIFSQHPQVKKACNIASLYKKD
jgi:hypothetical protein